MQVRTACSARIAALCLLFCAVIAAFLTPGCNRTAADDRIVIRMWTFPMMPELRDHELYDDLTGAFEKEHPHLDVQVEVLPWTGRMQKMMTAIAGNRQPDAVYINLDLLLGFINMDALQPLDEYVTKEEISDYPDDVVEAISHKGKVWFLPILRTLASGLYNKQLFREAGLDPEDPPDTWEELAAAIKALTKDTNGDGHSDQWGFGFIFGGETLNFTFWPLLWQAGGEVLTPDGRRAAFNTPAGLEALNWIISIYRQDSVPQSFMNLGGNEFPSGRLGIWWGVGSMEAMQLRRDAPNLDFGALPVPQNRRRLTYSTVAGYGIFRGSRHPRETAEWLRFVTRPDNMKKFCLAANHFPAKQSVGRIYADDPVLGALEENLQYGRPDVKSIVARQIMPPVSSEIQAVAFGKKTPEQALADAEKLVNAILAREVKD